MTLGELPVGTKVYLQVYRATEYGDLTKWYRDAFTVVQHGKPDDSYDDSFAGGTVLMYGPGSPGLQYGNPAANSKSDYSGSQAHTAWFDPEASGSRFPAALKPEILAAVRTVRLPYRTGTTGTTVTDGANGLPARFWLPSVTETARGVYEKSNPLAQETFTRPYVTEGAPFAYFDGKSAADYAEWSGKSAGSTSLSWYTRTPARSSSDRNFYAVGPDGGARIAGATVTAVCRPCFVLPDSMAVSGSYDLQLVAGIPVKVGGVWRESEAWCRENGVWHSAGQVCTKVNGVWYA